MERESLNNFPLYSLINVREHATFYFNLLQGVASKTKIILNHILRHTLWLLEEDFIETDWSV